MVTLSSVELTSLLQLDTAQTPMNPAAELTTVGLDSSVCRNKVRELPHAIRACFDGVEQTSKLHAAKSAQYFIWFITIRSRSHVSGYF